MTQMLSSDKSQGKLFQYSIFFHQDKTTWYSVDFGSHSKNKIQNRKMIKKMKIKAIAHEA